jgi:hypothetical protein
VDAYHSFVFSDAGVDVAETGGISSINAVPAELLTQLRVGDRLSLEIVDTVIFEVDLKGSAWAIDEFEHCRMSR